MSDVNTLARSFARGEIAPEMYGRIDLTQYQTGVQLARNMIVLPHGPTRNRPGFKYVNRCKVSTSAVRLIPFHFNNTASEQSFVLEVGTDYVRFHSVGGTLLEAAKTITGITRATPGVLTSNAHGFSNGQWVYVAAIVGMTQLNGRFYIVAGVTANTFTLTDLDGTAINTSAMTAYASGGTAARVYEVALGTALSTTDVQQFRYAQSGSTLTICAVSSRKPFTISTTDGITWTVTAITFAPTTPTPAKPAPVAGSASGAAFSYYYRVTEVPASGEESLASPDSDPVVNTLSVAGAYNYVGNAVTAGSRARIYKFYTGVTGNSGGLFGFVGEADPGVSFYDANITPDFTRTQPQPNTPFETAFNYPRAVCFYEQRQVFAGTKTNPQTFWMTRPGTDRNLTYTSPTADNDAISFRLSSKDLNVVNHLVPLGDLLMLTGGAVHRLQTANTDALTPASVSVKPLSFTGASEITPAVTESSCLFAAARGNHLREIRYRDEQGGYTFSDASLFAAHMVDGYTLNSLAYTAAPHQVVWAVRSDGVLLGMTYVPEQEVVGWHQHTHGSAGTFESICQAYETTEDALYATVLRARPNGLANVREIHVLKMTEHRAARFYVDAGLTYSGVSTTTITGLWHLEGSTVTILADNAEHPTRVVSGGQITLQSAASTVHVGFGYNSDLQTLPLASEAAVALGQGVVKNVAKVHFRVRLSAAFKVGPSFTDMREIKFRTTEAYGTPPALKSEWVSIPIAGEWGRDGDVCIRQDKPLPIEIAAMRLEVAVSD